MKMKCHVICKPYLEKTENLSSAQVLPHLVEAGSQEGQSFFIEGIDDFTGIPRGKLEQLKEGALRHKVQLACLHYKRFDNS